MSIPFPLAAFTDADFGSLHSEHRSSQTLVLSNIHRKRRIMTISDPPSSLEASVEDTLYEPLADEFHIRVFRLFAGDRYEPLRGELHVHSVHDEDLTYEAISYTWGNALGTDNCSINGINLSISRNLENTLRRIRSASQDRYLWADAICIDQKALSERNHQVALMSEIFSRAIRVLAWLGDPKDGSDTIIDYLKDSALSEAATAWKSVSRTPGFDDGGLRERLLDNPKAPGYLISFLNRDYFSRTWVWQEVAAREAHFFCGIRTITLLELNTCLQFLVDKQLSRPVQRASSTLPRDEIEAIISDSGFKRVYALLDIAISNQVLTLHALLLRMEQTNCSDIRDRIFAILGLVKLSRDTPAFRPDYNLTAAELFFAVIDHCKQPENLGLATILMERLELKENDVLALVDKHPNNIFQGLQCSSIQSQLNGTGWRKTKTTFENWLFVAPTTRSSPLTLRNDRQKLEYFAQVCETVTVSPCDIVLVIESSSPYNSAGKATFRSP